MAKIVVWFGRHGNKKAGNEKVAKKPEVRTDISLSGMCNNVTIQDKGLEDKDHDQEGAVQNVEGFVWDARHKLAITGPAHYAIKYHCVLQ